MKLYKYRSLKNFEFVLDIALRQRLYCPTYNDLNDPFEGLFKDKLRTMVTRMNVMGLPFMASRFGNGFVHKSVEDMTTDIPRICSLSSSLNDVRLWSHYADGHKGVVFEIDFKGIEPQVNEVTYSKDLPVFSTSILGGAIPKEVLLCKTDHWEYEAEYRIFHDDDYFDISNRLTAIYFGSRIDESQYDLLMRILPEEIPKFETEINRSKVIVEPIIEAG